MSGNIHKSTMNVVFVGHVDHGKSTVIGRLLADTGSLPQGKLEKVKLGCARNSKPFEYAFLIDALKDEQSQGITIDTARVFFKTKKRDYIIIDAPGHIEFLKNMITGASRANAAILVIDALEGIKENSRRHGYMLSMLGISQITVLVNKMDLVNYQNQAFEKIVSEYKIFLQSIGIADAVFIPVSAVYGDMIAARLSNIPWYKGLTVLEILDDFKDEKRATDKPLRLPVQDVYKFTKFGDNRRIVAGTIESGTVKVGDELAFYPSGKVSKVKSIERFNSKQTDFDIAGSATGITLSEQIYVRRGEIAVKASDPRPPISTRLRVSLFWLSREPMVIGKEYRIKIATAAATVTLESIERIIDASDLKALGEQKAINRHDVAECVLRLNRALCFDLIESIESTGRFVIVDNYEISGGGIIRQALKDSRDELRSKAILRNYKWIKSGISCEQREAAYSQRPTLVLVSGSVDSPRKDIARALEKQLFIRGAIVYFLGIGSIIYGIDSDIDKSESSHDEHLRRLGEVANIILDSGMILIVTASSLSSEDIKLIQTLLDYGVIETVWVGDEPTDIDVSIRIAGDEAVDRAVERVEAMLIEKGHILKK
jgi:bifunctional enzyme CysN/CysC